MINMTTLDLNDAGPQRSFDLIPAGTICTLQMVIRMGGAGEGGWLTRSKDGGCEMLDVEFVVVDTEFAKRKLWQMMVLSGTTDGHAKAAEISRTLLRGIVESARGIRPDDKSEAASNGRKADFNDFMNLRFVARIGVEKSRDPAYPDPKNKIAEAITPDLKQWHAVEQIPSVAQMGLPGMTNGSATPATAKPAQSVTRPQWAEQQ
jgi:hypothetical protein